MSLLYQIISLMWMLVWRLFVYAHVYTFLHVFTVSYWWTTLVSRAWFPSGWCGPDRCANRQQRACSIFFIFRNTGTTSINFPVWYHRWWSNLGEFQRHENTTGLSFMGCADSWWWGFHVWQCLYLVPVADLSCLQIGDVWWKHVRCNNLSFDLVHCGGIVFSLHLPSFGSSPKTIARFRIFQAGCSWRFIQTVLQLPFSLCFSHSSRSS